ncbi:DNA phosphorothioation-associated protein 4 [Streptomyces sp. TRM66268-LWL]|uniref:DNA phosphorothioation-associated protein 4 n=1 Tax=Streptomyces polyasparticus TaxID=2767826 RepID=A0ABR7STA0_9ACTN|nr:DNA phosphorothioation-associated protein 4 [Streptomyces polyasparticus]MBC9717837.1 DNA phosphorothioation-associated protein 4 [Streptomyces polyasparticus]
MAYEDRFRRPAAHEELLGALTGKDAPFNSMVEVLMFAAMLGRQKGKREPFEKAGEPIRLAIMEARTYGDVLMDMLAVVEDSDDPKILGDERQPERVRIFEEYANGGLNFIQGEVNASGGKDYVAIISTLVMDSLTAPDGRQSDVMELMQSASLDW